MLLPLGCNGISLGQIKTARIITNGYLPIQVDGEPVLFQPSEIIINIKINH
jgi:hypothetical protein